MWVYGLEKSSVKFFRGPKWEPCFFICAHRSRSGGGGEGVSERRKEEWVLYTSSMLSSLPAVRETL